MKKLFLLACAALLLGCATTEPGTYMNMDSSKQKVIIIERDYPYFNTYPYDPFYYHYRPYYYRPRPYYFYPHPVPYPRKPRGGKH